MVKKFYVVPGIKTKHEVSIADGMYDFKTIIKINWADGMFGAMPVFTNRRKAEKYAGKELKHKIIVLEGVE